MQSSAAKFTKHSNQNANHFTQHNSTDSAKAKWDRTTNSRAETSKGPTHAVIIIEKAQRKNPNIRMSVEMLCIGVTALRFEVPEDENNCRQFCKTPIGPQTFLLEHYQKTL